MPVEVQSKRCPAIKSAASDSVVGCIGSPITWSWIISAKVTWPGRWQRKTTVIEAAELPMSQDDVTGARLHLAFASRQAPTQCARTQADTAALGAGDGSDTSYSVNGLAVKQALLDRIQPISTKRDAAVEMEPKTARPFFDGGCGNRTHDTGLMSPLLYQLS